MTEVHSRALPPPSNWQDFERICFDLYSRLWKTNDAEMHGRQGQPQAGVDVYGTDRVEQKFVGVQCKGKDGDFHAALTRAELRDEVQKAKSFTPTLDVFVVATTASNDEAIQSEARLISQEHAKLGIFEVRVQGWTTLRQHITSHLDVLSKHFRDFAPVDVLAKVEKGITATEEGDRKIESAMAGMEERLLAAINGKIDVCENDPLQIKIVATAQMVDEGGPQAALRGLRRLWKEEGEGASRRNRFRLRANIGNALLRLGDRAGAVAEFRAGYDEDPDWPNAKAFLATAALIEGDKETAFTLAGEAMQADPTSHQAVHVLLDAAPPDLTLTELVQRVSAPLHERLDINLAFAFRARKASDLAQAEIYARKALAIDAEDWRARSALGEVLVEPIFSIPGLALTHQIPREQQARFAEALDLLRGAWATLLQRDDAFIGDHVAANLLSALEIAGLESESELVLDQALKVAPHAGPLLRRYARKMIDLDDWPSAAQAVESIKQEDREPDDQLLRVQAMIHTDRLPDALALAKSLEGSLREGRHREFAAAMIIEAAIKADALEQELPGVLQRWSNSVVVHSAVVTGLNEDEPYRAASAAAIDRLVADATHPGDRFHAAEALYATRQFSRAADLYAPLHTLDQDSVPLRRRLKSLYFAERRREARELFDSLSDALKVQREISKLGVAIYERSGLLAEARQLLERELTAEETLERRLHWLGVCERLGDLEAVRGWLEQVTDPQGAPGDLMMLAIALDRHLGSPQALQIGYRALRLGYGDPQIHLGYTVGLFLMGRATRKGLPAPTTVGPDTAVHLKEKDGERNLIRVIETDPTPNIERGEIPTDHELAKMLVGLQVGDEVEIENLGLGPSCFVVEEIHSKFLHAHFRSLHDFKTLFPENKALGEFQLDENKGEDRFKPIFDTAKRRGENARKIEDAYKTGNVPLGFVATVSGAEPPDIWEAFSSSGSVRLQVTAGARSEFQQAHEILATHRAAVIEPLTLYGLVQLDLGDAVKACFEQVMVVQSTIDLLRHCVLERQARVGTRQSSLAWDGERYHMIELTDEAIAQQVTRAEKALSFAESLTLAPAEAATAAGEETHELFEGMHGAFLDSALAAQVEGRVLLSDDLALRVVAASTLNVPSVWTQVALQSGVQAQSIAPKDYREAAIRLIEANYSFTMFGDAEVLHVLAQSEWERSARLDKLIELLGRRSNDPESIRSFLAALIVSAWREAPNRAAFRSLFSAIAAGIHAAQPDANLQELFQAAFDRASADLDSRAIGPRFKASLKHSSSATPVESIIDLLRMPADRVTNKISQELSAALDASGAS